MKKLWTQSVSDRTNFISVSLNLFDAMSKFLVPPLPSHPGTEVNPATRDSAGMASASSWARSAAEISGTRLDEQIDMSANGPKKGSSLSWSSGQAASPTSPG